MKRGKTLKKRCRKLAYPSRREAQRALAEFGKGIGAKRSYRCPRCTGIVWHITSMEAKK